jgi:hypothetical protein
MGFSGAVVWLRDGPGSVRVGGWVVFGVIVVVWAFVVAAGV